MPYDATIIKHGREYTDTDEICPKCGAMMLTPVDSPFPNQHYVTIDLVCSECEHEQSIRLK